MQGLEAVIQKRLAFFTLNIAISCVPGKIVILTGPSGSGKTTVLRCLAGLEPIDGGFIRFHGAWWNDPKVALKVTPQARGVGLLSQDYALFPHMTVGQNIQFAMKKREDPGRLLVSMKIGHLRDKYPGAISGGERQRAALCQILARRPQLLLLDEPFSALDRENRLALRQVLLEVQTEFGLPMIQVTHDLAEALTLSATVIAVREGREDALWLQRQKDAFIYDISKLYCEYSIKAAIPHSISR